MTAEQETQANRLVIAIVGPTCSGKTAVGVALAELIGGEIISADSRQLYKLMDIGTAKPSLDERARIAHHFIDVISLEEEMSAGVYGKVARQVIDEIFARSRRPIIVGGSGLYLRALTDGLFESPDINRDLRKSLRDRLDSEGGEKLLEELKGLDPKAAEGLIPQNHKRILRALEVYYSSGIQISELREQFPSAPDFQTLQFGLSVDRKVLYHNIEKRVDEMIEKGLVDEVKEIVHRGFDPNLNSLQTVGYRETNKYIQGAIKFEEMVEQIKMNTRRYAKRQMTWFRKDSRIIWIQVDERTPGDVAKEILKRFGGA